MVHVSDEMRRVGTFGMEKLLGDGLAGLATDLFVLIPDSLAFVGLRLAAGANLSGELPDEMLVDTLNDDVRLIRAEDVEPCRNRQLKFVREAHTQLQRVFLDRSDISNANDLELLFVSLGNSLDHVRRQCPSEAMQRSRSPIISLPSHLQLAVCGINRHCDCGVDAVFQFAQGAFDLEHSAIDSDLDALRYLDRRFPNP